MTRRFFVNAAAASAVASGVASGANSKLALQGGTPVRTTPFPSWPRTAPADEQALVAVVKTGRWYRGAGKQVDRFEEKYASLLGAKHCLATANGTSALITSLYGLGVEPGDEVLVPPYTFVATVNAVLMHHALPVFVDTDPHSFQMDAKKVEAAITERTKVILPVHVGGAPADLDTILGVASKHKLAVLEDACQAHLAEWRGRKVATGGTAGCYSFQNSKNLNSGEGGAILTNSDDLVERCFAYHNNGRGRKVDSYHFAYTQNGANLRMTEFQAALLMTQMIPIEQNAKLREQNAAHLTSLLKEIPGVEPAKPHEGCTRNAFHLYMLRYRKEQFGGLSRAAFLKALKAEGIPASGGYTPLNKEPFLQNALKSRVYQALYPKATLEQWVERNECPVNDQLCQEAVWFTQNVLLDTRQGMEQIAEAIRKVQANARAIAS
ncbi:MAG TPA: DegT/DnrJ/EryC1/StrS family aminotransferase [Bryobacteraceae bacterium]|nr:DegT/DnrJ/EryC1/StrS family aminotransferase [Bryobacteraceae bacterium]